MSPRLYYTAFMVLALIVFLVMRHFMPKPAGLTTLPPWKRALLTLAGFIGGVLGAKLPFVLASGVAGLGGTAWLADGKTITTGLLGAYLAVELAKWGLEVRVKTGD